MSTIKASVSLGTPIDRVHAYLNEGLTHVAQTGPCLVPLVAHVPATGIVLSKNVKLECVRQDDGSDDWWIHWTPLDGGFYPSFDGTLSVRAGHGHTTLTLTGDYSPPLGIAGQVFDTAVGHLVSDDTAHEFLMTLAADMRARYAYEEAVKEYAT